MNLYNNGFSCGLIAIFLYPLIVGVLHQRKFSKEDESYFDIFVEDAPVTVTEEDLSKKGAEEN